VIDFDVTALGLLAEIADNPDDDAPRLVFADWLDERGGEDERAWAELIRVQLERARLVPGSAADEALDPRDDELTRRLKERLVRPMPRVPGMIPEFERGMLRLSAHAKHFFTNEEKVRAWLREQGPSVVSLYLHTFPAGKTASLTAYFQEGLPPIDLHFNRGAAKDGGVAHAARLSRLVALVAMQSHVSDRGVTHLTALNHLRSLTLEAPRVTDVGAKYLAELDSLRELGLFNTRLTDDGFERLTGLTELRSLSLNGTRISGAGLRALARLTRLERLLLSRMALGDSTVEVIAGLPALRSLSLTETAVTDAGLACLRESLSLKILNANKTSVTPAGKAALRAARPDLYVYN
jgi:uncharacterized protein (TIGR02996 family)